MRYAPTKRKRGVGQPIRASNTQKKPGHPRFVAPLRDVFLLDGFTRAQEDAMKLLTALITLVPAINNRWAFAAFVILVAVFLYRGRRQPDVQGPLARGSRHCLIGWAKLPMPARPRGGVVTQRSAKPFTPVQFRAWPPTSSCGTPSDFSAPRLALRGRRERRAVSLQSLNTFDIGRSRRPLPPALQCSPVAQW